MRRACHHVHLDAAPGRADQPLEDHRILVPLVLNVQRMPRFVDEMRDPVPAVDGAPQQAYGAARNECLPMPVRLEARHDLIDLVPVIRDDRVVTDHRHEVDEIVACFEADWHRQAFVPGGTVRLLWCPINGRDRIAHFIDEARHTLYVQNERYQDSVILERLVRAARRGVKVHVMARPPHSLKQDQLIEGVGGLRMLDDVGVKVRKLKGLKLHGKMLLADGVTAIVGSINLAPGSFDSRRELAIEVRDAAVVDRLHTLVKLDKENSHPLDLSDDGLLSDLADRQEEAAEKLALTDHSKKKAKET